jgi:hypothetical protein
VVDVGVDDQGPRRELGRGRSGPIVKLKAETVRSRNLSEKIHLDIRLSAPPHAQFEVLEEKDEGQFPVILSVLCSDP